MNEGEGEYVEATGPHPMDLEMPTPAPATVLELRSDLPRLNSDPALTTTAAEREEFSRTVTQLSTQRTEQETKRRRKPHGRPAQSTRVLFFDDDAPLELLRSTNAEVLTALIMDGEDTFEHVNAFGLRRSGIADAQLKSTEYYKLATLLDEVSALQAEFDAEGRVAILLLEEEKGEMDVEESAPSSSTPTFSAASTRAATTKKEQLVEVRMSALIEEERKRTAAARFAIEELPSDASEAHSSGDENDARPSSAPAAELARYRVEYADVFDWESAATADGLFGLREVRAKQILRGFFHGNLAPHEIAKSYKLSRKRVDEVIDRYIEGARSVKHGILVKDRELRLLFRNLIGDVLLDRLHRAEELGAAAPSLRELARYIGRQLNVRDPSPNTIRSILHDDLGYRYVLCSRRFNPASTEEMRRDDARFEGELRKLYEMESSFELLFVDEFAAGFSQRTMRSWRFLAMRKAVRSLRHTGFNCLVATTRSGLYAAQILRNCTTNQERFAFFLQSVLRKRIAEMQAAGDGRMLIVVMDNAPIHKTAVIENLLRSTGVLALTLRAYKPELNLAEYVIRNIQVKLRNVTKEKL